MWEGREGEKEMQEENKNSQRDQNTLAKEESQQKQLPETQT